MVEQQVRPVVLQSPLAKESGVSIEADVFSHVDISETFHVAVTQMEPRNSSGVKDLLGAYDRALVDGEPDFRWQLEKQTTSHL